MDGKLFETAGRCSFDWDRDVWSCQKITSTQKLVLLAISQHVNTDGEGWPSLRRLSRMTGCSRSTIIRSISELEDMRLIVSEKRNRKDGSLASNNYRLSAEGLKAWIIKHGSALEYAIDGGNVVVRQSAQGVVSSQYHPPKEVVAQSDQGGPEVTLGGPEVTRDEQVYEQVIEPKDKKTIAADAEAPDSRSVVSLYLGGGPSKVLFHLPSQTWHFVDPEYPAYLKKRYGGLDVDREIEKARVWVSMKHKEAPASLPKERYDLFLRNWLKKASDTTLNSGASTNGDRRLLRPDSRSGNRGGTRIDFGDNSPTLQAMRAKGLA